MNKLEQKLIDRIVSDGPITFCDFMEAALYDEELGYYNTERLKIGPKGDYYTSSNVHAAFGDILARAFIELGHKVISKSNSSSRQGDCLSIVEIGAGTGQLAADILAALSQSGSSLFEQVSYRIVERSAVMRKRQREKLSAYSDRVTWSNLSEHGTAIEGIIFSNEFFDALPVHRIRVDESALEELYVTVKTRETSQPTLDYCWGPLSSQRIDQYVKRMAIPPVEQQLIEVNLQAIDWLRQISRILSRGFVVTLDYGDMAPHLYSQDRSKGTLRCFYNHALTDEPLTRIGEQDITASVNFTALVEYGRDFGLETVSLERQTAFLVRNGLIERIARQEARAGGSLDDMRERLALKNLLVPGGVSDNFRVLIQRRIE